MHRAANYHRDEEEGPEATHVKKRSKEERREAKAAANRARAAAPPPKQSKRTPKPPPPKPPPEPPVARGVRSKYRPRSASFAEFERDFALFEGALGGARRPTFAVRDIPRPPAHDAIGAARAPSEREWRAAWRKGVLLWHPDKWSALAEKVDDVVALTELTQAMTRAVLREKERGYRAE